MKNALQLALVLCVSALRAHAQDAGPAPQPPAATPAVAAPTQPSAAMDTDPSQHPTESNAAELVALPAAPVADVETLKMTEAELAALGLNTQQSGMDTSLNVSGFADFTGAVQFTPHDSLWRGTGSAPAHPSFYVGSFNVYLRKELTDSLRTLGEVRFSYMPNGESDPLTKTRLSTEVHDYTDFGRAQRWGSIEIQRIYLEWTAYPLLTIRGGQFLTPYGIWNVDHGTPTYIPILRPFVVGLGWFPERQTGLELFGRQEVSSDAILGYHLTLSNGTGPVAEYLDLDDNKAIGARLYFEYRGLGKLRLGASAYYGRETSASSGYLGKPNGGDLGASEHVDRQFDALAWAADASWILHGFHVQAEWISYQRAYTTRGRTAVSYNGLLQIPADASSWGMYGLVGYRFEWLGIMPFIVVEHIDGDFDTSKLTNITFQGGFNVRPVEPLTLKLGYYFVKFFKRSLFGSGPLNMVQAQAAWTF